MLTTRSPQGTRLSSSAEGNARLNYLYSCTLSACDTRDVTSLGGLPTGAQYPTKDDNGNLLTTEYGLCTYKDSQVVTIQELPETAPPGQVGGV